MGERFILGHCRPDVKVFSGVPSDSVRCSSGRQQLADLEAVQPFGGISGNWEWFSMAEKIGSGSFSCRIPGRSVYGSAGIAEKRLGDQQDTSRLATGGISTGIGRMGDEPIGDSLGELVKGPTFSAGVAADLALVEDQ